MLLDKSQLLDQEFRLADCDVNDFTVAPVSGDLVKLDLLRVGSAQGDYEPTKIQLKDNEIRKLKDYLSSLIPRVSGVSLQDWWVTGWARCRLWLRLICRHTSARFWQG